MRAAIEAELSSKLDAKLVKELLDAHAEAKRNFYLGGLRLSAVEGGRFCEAVFRLLQDVTEGKHTALTKTLPKTDDLIFKLSQLDSPSLTTRSAAYPAVVATRLRHPQQA